MFKRHLQSLGLPFVLRSLRRLRTGDKSGAALLSETRRTGSVALVWALDQDGEHLSEEVMSQLDRLSDFETVVVVCPPRYFGTLRSRDHFFETLPTPDEISDCGLSRDWDLYLSRRIDRIRKSWAPDFEFTIGRSPQDYLASFRDIRQL